LPQGECAKKKVTEPPKEEPKQEVKEEVKTFKWKMSDVNTGTTLTDQACVYFATKVKEKTNGRITIDVFANGVIGSESETIDQVDAGTLEMSFATAMGIGPLVPEFSVLDGAFLIKDIDHHGRVVNSDAAKELFLA